MGNDQMTVQRYAQWRWLGIVWLWTLTVEVVAQPIDPPLQLAWTNNMLTISGGAAIPGGAVKIWYLEAFCRSGGHDRDWSQTTIPHHTELISASKDRRHIKLRTMDETDVEILHDIRSRTDEVEFRLILKNHGDRVSDLQWFQPCLRVDGFTGRGQSNYHERCFIFTESGLATLSQTKRTEEARYRGGQVYVPSGIQYADVNPRPISPDRPLNGLIGCYSKDGERLMAMAWDKTHELFQGVIVCIHNDPHVGGLKPGETKTLRGKVYLLKNDPPALLKRYRRDFPE